MQCWLADIHNIQVCQISNDQVVLHDVSFHSSIPVSTIAQPWVLAMQWLFMSNSNSLTWVLLYSSQLFKTMKEKYFCFFHLQYRSVLLNQTSSLCWFEIWMRWYVRKRFVNSKRTILMQTDVMGNQGNCKVYNHIWYYEANRK